MAASVDFTISFDNPDEASWILAGVLDTVLTPDEDLAGEVPESDREHLWFTAAT